MMEGVDHSEDTRLPSDDETEASDTMSAQSVDPEEVDWATGEQQLPKENVNVTVSNRTETDTSSFENIDPTIADNIDQVELDSCKAQSLDLERERSHFTVVDFPPPSERVDIIETLMYWSQGPPIAPDEFRKITWITMEADLQDIISSGMIPQDTLASAGIDEESYDHFEKCVNNIREHLWEGDLKRSLSILRGSRRIFSASNHHLMRHAFRGPPLEVLANIYFGGMGVLPKDRMILQDPYHYSVNPDNLDDD